MADPTPKSQEGQTRRVELRLSVLTIKRLFITASARDMKISEVAEEIFRDALPELSGDVAALAS